jgi:hypothetical protein
MIRRYNYLLILGLILASCSPAIPLIPTHVPTKTSENRPTETFTPSQTFTPTDTLTPTFTPTETQTLTPTETPELKSALEISLDSSLIEQLNKIESAHEIKRYTSSEVIDQMGTTDPALIDLYKKFFDGNWQYFLYPNMEFRGLGYYTNPVDDKFALWEATGLFYGIVPIENVPENVQTTAKAYGVEARPRYAILQIQPGKDLTPQENPEAFLAVQMGIGYYRTVEKGKTYRGIDAWSVTELEKAFGLQKGSLVHISGRSSTPEQAGASWFMLMMNEYPAADVQDQFQFELGL